ncbi:MAG: hypothetical protein H7177_10190 [Rhizobacter sp.]|nr:hypothetical protein [Bacteriovorax sp.]
MDFIFLPPGLSGDQIQEYRKKCDCIMIDFKKLQTTDSYIIDDESFFKLQPLRLVVIRLKDFNYQWGILKDRFRRNTMIVASDIDVRSYPEISQYLESQGVALLMCRSEGNGLSLESLTKSLSSLKFKSILVEDRIDLIKEFSM